MERVHHAAEQAVSSGSAGRKATATGRTDAATFND